MVRAASMSASSTGVGSKISARAVLIPHHATFAQPVADRIVQTLRALTDIDQSDGGKCTDPVPARFYALFDGSCAARGRPR